MIFGILLLPAVAGYWLLTHWHYTRFRSERDSGYHLLFRSAGVGIVLYCIARILTFVLASWNSFPILFWEAHVPEPFTSEVIISLALGFLAPYIFNIFCWEAHCATRTAENFGDQVELRLDDSVWEHRLVEIDLHNRKVYIGYAIESGIGKGAEADMVLLPVFSGYRNWETLTLVLDIDYRPYVANLIQEQPNPNRNQQHARDFVIVIPLNEILSVRFFDLSIFTQFHERRPSDQGSPTQSQNTIPDETQSEPLNQIIQDHYFPPISLLVLILLLLIIANFIVNWF